MSELALQLIAKNKRTRDTFLDLGKCGLTKVPSEVGELVWLKSLSLSDRCLKWDGREWEEKESQNAGGSNDLLIDLGPLAGLAALQVAKSLRYRSR